ncbi:MAG: S8 family serine peptidase [Pseudomonadota bacterium]
MMTAAIRALAVLACVAGSPAVGQTVASDAAPASVTETSTVYTLIPITAGTQALRAASEDLGYTAEPDVVLAGLGLILVRHGLPEGVTGAEAIAALEGRVPEAVVGVNHAYRSQTSPAQAAPVLYADTLVDWPQSGCVARARVGMIDGGVNVATPVLAGVQVEQAVFGGGSPAGQRHGTEVASVIADPARLSDVRLFNADVMADLGDGDIAGGAAQISQALDWLVTQDVRIVNMSFAGPRNKLLALAVNRATDQGLTLVAAVGNLGPQADPQYPAAFEDVVAVTAVDANMRVLRAAVRGDHVDLAAPGVDIFVAGASGGRYVSGTSMAAPFVTAMLATQGDANPELLFSAATDLGDQGKDPVFGHGLAKAPAGCAGDQ